MGHALNVDEKHYCRLTLIQGICFLAKYKETLSSEDKRDLEKAMMKTIYGDNIS